MSLRWWRWYMLNLLYKMLSTFCSSNMYWVCQQCMFSLNSFGSVMKTTMTIKIQGKGGEGATFQRYLRPCYENLEYILDHVFLERFKTMLWKLYSSWNISCLEAKIFEVTYHENCIRVLNLFCGLEFSACLHEGSLTVTTKTHLQIEPSYALDFWKRQGMKWNVQTWVSRELTGSDQSHSNSFRTLIYTWNWK